MKPPEASTAGNSSQAAPSPTADPNKLHVLRKRSDFLSVAKGLRQATTGLILQARQRGADAPIVGIRVGFTCSKKVGNSVARNRAKRRLREVARLVLPSQGVQGWDYVLIGRASATANRPFDRLQADLRAALATIHPVRQ